MDISPLIRPVLPSPPKHDRTRRAVVTQWDFFFFIEPWTNTFTQTHTPNHTQKQNTQRQTSSDRGTWKDIQWCHCWNIQEWFKEMTKCRQITTQREHKDAFTQRQKSGCSVMFYPLWLLYISAHMFIALWYHITFDIAALPALFVC